MKTAEHKLRHIMEAAGECWHRASYFSFASKGEIRCEKCKRMVKYQNTDRTKDPAFAANPSPDDLNELFRLAEKLSLQISLYSTEEDNKVPCIRYNMDCFSFLDSDVEAHSSAKTPQEAILAALFIATGGKDNG